LPAPEFVYAKATNCAGDEAGAVSVSGLTPSADSIARSTLRRPWPWRGSLMLSAVPSISATICAGVSGASPCSRSADWMSATAPLTCGVA
jgi:hypothetical protein